MSCFSPYYKELIYSAHKEDIFDQTDEKNMYAYYDQLCEQYGSEFTLDVLENAL
jgi:hypothetical protein